MLQILSSLTLGHRVDVKASAWVLASGHTGTFVAISGDNGAVQPTAGKMAFPVWSESNRDLKGGFSPDIAATGNVTLYYGKLHGLTDQYTGTPAAGDALSVDANGKLKTAESSEVVVAYCTKAADVSYYLSKKFNAIEFVLA